MGSSTSNVPQGRFCRSQSLWKARLQYEEQLPIGSRLAGIMLGRGGDVDRDGHKMCHGTQDHEDVPNLMKTEPPWHEVQDLGSVHNRTQCVKDAASAKPNQRARRQFGQHLLDTNDDQPAQQQIHTGAQPPGRLDEQELEPHAQQRECPHDRQQAPLPEARKHVVAEWSVTPRYQQVDGRMIELAKPAEHARTRLHHVVRGAGGEQQHQSAAVHQQRNLLANAGCAGHDQADHARQGSDRSAQMTVTIHRLAHGSQQSQEHV